MFNGLAQPKSRGRLLLSGSDATDPILIEPNSLSEPEDMAAVLAAVELGRELGYRQHHGALCRYRRAGR